MNKQFKYEQPNDIEILKAYINKNANYNRADARIIKRALRKLTVHYGNV